MSRAVAFLRRMKVAFWDSTRPLPNPPECVAYTPANSTDGAQLRAAAAQRDGDASLAAAAGADRLHLAQDCAGVR